MRLLFDALWVCFLDMFHERDYTIKEVPSTKPVNGLTLTHMFDAKPNELVYPHTKMEVN